MKKTGLNKLDYIFEKTDIREVLGESVKNVE